MIFFSLKSFYLQQYRRNNGYLRNKVLFLKDKELSLEAKNSKKLVLFGLVSFERRIIIRHCFHYQRRRYRQIFEKFNNLLNYLYILNKITLNVPVCENALQSTKYYKI